MTIPKVKICGLTNLKDALLACELGAFAVGFVFVQSSPRKVTGERAQVIIQRLPVAVSKVGVFANQSVEEVAAIADQAGLDTVQLHGSEDGAFVSELKALRPQLKIIKAFELASSQQIHDVGNYSHADYLLMDSAGGRSGAKSRPVLTRELVQSFEVARPFFLAGGLNPDNVTEAIRNFQPFAVDVSSGVESDPGMKSGHKMQKFFKAIGEARGY